MHSPGQTCLRVLALVASGLLLLSSARPADAALTVRYRITDSWSGGFQGEIRLENPSSSAVTGWHLGFDLAAGIDDVWGAQIASHSGNRYELTPVAWSSTVPAQGSMTIGFVARHGGAQPQPTACQLDGVACNFLVTSGTPAPGASPTPGASPRPSPTSTLSQVYRGHGPSIDPIFNYGEALQKSWYFLEAQRSGPLPRFDGDLPFFDPANGTKLHDGFLANRIPWRGDSDVADGADVGLDLTGGWHDAGDHVKFGLPMAFSASFLAWGVLEFEDAYRESGQLEWAKDSLRWVADYFVRAHPSANVLYGQVGQGSVDHTIWGAPEVMPHFRPAWKIDTQHPGSDLAAQTSSALTIISMVFRNDEPVYADALLRHAKQLYDFAQATRSPETPTDKSLGRYSDSILDARSFYASTSGAQDDLPWAAAWLYKATGEARYLRDAEKDYTRVADNTGHTAWTAVWDDVRYGLYALMAEIAAQPRYLQDSQLTSADRVNGFFDYERHASNFLNHWLENGGVARTPAGMAWLSGWASARYNTMTAFIALVYRKHLVAQAGDPNAIESYLNFATEQVNYVLGDNPLDMSYVVGFGDRWSQVAHHRASHGSTTNDVSNPALPRFVLYGGLAGGPKLDDGYTDDRNAFSLTEVATDMNAGLNGAFAGLVDAYGLAGNEPDPDFPPAQPAYDEVFATARLVQQQPASLGTQVSVTLVNETAYPPRITDGLVFRYFVDLSELAGSGRTASDVGVDVYRNEGAGVSPLRRWKNSASIYYVEGSFVGTDLVPIGTSQKQKTIEFLVRLPWGSSGWDGSNDPSRAGLNASGAVKTSKIAVYDTSLPSGAQLVWGVEPDPGSPSPSLTPSPSPTPKPSVTATPAPTASPSPRPSTTPSPKPTASPSPKPSATPSSKPSASPSPKPTPTPSPRPSASPKPTATPTPKPTPTKTPTPAPSASPTRTPAATPTPIPGSLVASVVVESSWQDGYCAGIAVSNPSSVAKLTRTLRFRLPASVPITQSWNGTLTRSGDVVTVALPSWVSAVQPGETQKHFGLCANGSTLPSQPEAL